MKIIGKKELQKLIASGHAKPIHLYPFKDVLRPRGSLKKESLSLVILGALIEAQKAWAGKKYSDNPSEEELAVGLQLNLHEELDIAWNEFVEIQKNGK